MKCAISFLSVVVLVLAVSAAAIYIIWKTDTNTPVCEKQKNIFICEEDNNTCIPFSKLCDAKADCPNGSDEVAHHCADLNTLTQLFGQHDKLKANKTEEEKKEEEDVKVKGTCETESTCDESVEEGCSCSNCSVHCAKPVFARIPWEGFPNETTKLWLVNSLAEHGEYDWREGEHLARLQILVIENHQHSNGFPWELILQNEGLLQLYLSNNGIEKLPPILFNNKPRLTWLFMDNNKLEELSTDDFCCMPRLTWLTLIGNRLTLTNFSFTGLPKLSDLDLLYNSITEIGPETFKNLAQLTFLNLEGNSIRFIHKDAFVHNKELINLILARNQLTALEPWILFGLKNLNKLNFGYNPITKVSATTMCRLSNLESLNLTNIDIKYIEEGAFPCLRRLTYVHFKKFGYCRYAPKVPYCYPSTDGLSSIENLVGDAPLRLFIWVMAVLSIVGNITVLVSRWGSKRKRGILDVFINNLAVADMLTGVYLVTLAVKDIQLRGSYNLHAMEWTSSWVCSAIGVTAMISCEVSLLILTIMSLERYLVISGPFSAPKLSKTLAFVSMVIIWIFIIVLALTPLYQWNGKITFYGSSALCFPLHLDEPFMLGWEYSAFVFIGLNSCCLILISVSYGKLFYVIRQTRLSTPIFIRDMQMALRFFVMVVADFICWLPIIAFKVAVLHGYVISTGVHAWLLILVLPLNAALNPILYTFSTESVRVKFVQQVVLMISRVNHINRNPFGENRTFPHVGHTSDTPLCNSMLANKRQDDQHVCSLTHQDSVTSK